MNDFEKNKYPTFRTDLADEAVAKENIDHGMNMEKTINGIKILKTVINDDIGQRIGKKKGTYYSLDLSSTNFHDTSSCQKIELTLMEILDEVILSLGLKNRRCLVVGLGNVNVTPDSLGPYVLDNVVVTRHLFEMNTVNEGYSEVSGFSPGVMGNTGIETFDIISAITSKIDVDFMIVVDALAAASISRVNRTIQITDTGISPGSGVGNRRKELSFETLGIPVIAIGVPTVVDAVTISSDTIDYIIKYLNSKIKGKKQLANAISVGEVKIDYEKTPEASDDTKEHLMGEIGLLNEQEIKSLIEDVLTPNGYNMMVTPKEVDADIEDLAKIIAMGIDITLHDSLRQNYHKLVGLE